MKYEDSYQTFFLKNPAPMWIYDLGTLYFLAVNEAAVQRYGYSRTEFLALTIRDIRPPEDIPALLDEVSRSGEQMDHAGVWRHLTKGGELLFVDITSSPLEFEGRPAELVMALDVTQRMRNENALRHRLSVENTITEISSRFIATEDLDAAIDHTLQEIGMLGQASRAYLFLFRDDGKVLDNTHEWRAEGVSRQMNRLQGLPTDEFGWFVAQVRQGEVLPIPDVSALPAVAAAEKALLESQDIKSLIIMPVKIAGTVIGFIGFDNVYEAGPWRKADLALLQLAAEIIGGALGRQRSDLALRHSEARYRRLVEALPGIVYTYAQDTGASYWSPQVEAILGLKPDRLNSEPFRWHESIHPDDLPGVNRAIKEFATGKPIELEYRIRDAKGLWHWFLDRSVGSPRQNEPAMIEGIAIDITERKQAEEALRREKERAQVTLHSIGDAVITTDAQGRVEYINPVAEALTGWPAHEAQSRPLGEVFRIIQEETRQPAEDPASRCLKEGMVVGLANHALLVSRSGREYSIEDSAAPIRSENGEPSGVVLVFKDVTEARRLSREMSYHAEHDALTGLINRREFERRLQRVLETAREEATENALFYFDLDQFKLVNDTCGHVAGDELLRQLGQLLRAHVRQTDTLARLGGDEFGLLMEHCSLDEARRVAAKLIAVIAEFRFMWTDKAFNIGVSIGLVAITQASEEISVLLSAADTACYMAKEQGRNRVHVHQADDLALAKRHGEMRWAASLPQALDEDRFQLYFQPIVPVVGAQGMQEHCELLLRMEDEKGNLVSPGVFLPAAERYNLSCRLDRWVVNKAFQWFAAHPEDLDRLFICSINLSGLSLGDDGFLDFVKGQFEQWRIPPHKICFEITETVAIANLSDATLFIQSLKALGCLFALDDFGSGLSSFAYLKNLPVDFLKIDGVFVKDILDDPIDLALVKSINDIGQVMGKKTIAEFVENETILKKLREIGVDYAQGYGISRPQPIRDIMNIYGPR